MAREELKPNKAEVNLIVDGYDYKFSYDSKLVDGSVDLNPVLIGRFLVSQLQKYLNGEIGKGANCG